jgi:hypothetical protein
LPSRSPASRLLAAGQTQPLRQVNIDLLEPLGELLIELLHSLGMIDVDPLEDSAESIPDHGE